MVSEVFLNHTPIQILRYQDDNEEQQTGLPAKKMVIDFEVGSEDYHRITTLLYEMTFDVRVPEINWSGRATISNYSTSFTNLYKENQVGIFHLELTEVL